jgi:hypothetical protein
VGICARAAGGGARPAAAGADSVLNAWLHQPQDLEAAFARAALDFKHPRALEPHEFGMTEVERHATGTPSGVNQSVENQKCGRKRRRAARGRSRAPRCRSRPRWTDLEPEVAQVQVEQARLRPPRPSWSATA